METKIFNNANGFSFETLSPYPAGNVGSIVNFDTTGGITMVATQNEPTATYMRPVTFKLVPSSDENVGGSVDFTISNTGASLTGTGTSNGDNPVLSTPQLNVWDMNTHSVASLSDGVAPVGYFGLFDQDGYLNGNVYVTRLWDLNADPSTWGHLYVEVDNANRQVWVKSTSTTDNGIFKWIFIGTKYKPYMSS